MRQPMQVVVSTLLSLCLELLLGAALLRLAVSRRGSRRRSHLRAYEAGRLVGAAAPVALTVAAACAGLAWFSGLPPGSGTSWAVLAPAVLLPGVAATPGCWLVLCAGRLESRGRLNRARRQVRAGAIAMGWGTAAQALAAVAFALVAPPGRRVAPLAAAILLGAAGFVGLLAGLSGKPRPSGQFAALLYVAGRLALGSAPGWPAG